jgi:RNA-directed DNA polymerase
MKGTERWTPTTGTLQGAVISPLLANIYLHPLDLLMERAGYEMVRYADDFVILCRTAEDAAAALRQIRAWTTANGLTLHPDKTRIGNASERGQGFDFLGYRFERGYRFARQKSLNAFRDKLRARTRRSRGDSLERIIGDLNPRLRGWFNSFKQAVPSIHRLMDSFVRRRMRAIPRKQEKRPGFGRCPDDHARWPDKYFADLGLFTLSGAAIYGVPISRRRG